MKLDLINGVAFFASLVLLACIAVALLATVVL